MNQSKSLAICLIGFITILVTFSSNRIAAGETTQSYIYLPLVTQHLLENPPVAVDDTYSTNQDTQLVVASPGVLENDSDVDGDTLTAVWVSDPTHGNLTLNADGSFIYMPNAAYQGSDSFTYKAHDGKLESNIATVTITVNAVGPSCSTAPTLISPSKGSNPNTLIPTFQWNNGNVTDITEVHLLLLLHEDDFPNDWVYWVTAYDGSFDEERYDETNLVPATTYYWKVWLRCGEIESPHSEVWSFTTGSADLILPAPILFSPADGSEIWADDLPVILQWSTVTGAEEYKVVIMKWNSGSWYRDWYTTTTETEYIIPYTLTQNSYYKWYVQPINDYALGTTSSEWMFETRE
ncbi:cadherin-like domain-containing protein [Chloroflexota bacterium]